ncbi:MAG: DUF255 domain-containing protein [Planctomycetaceae bacterium]
MSRSKAVACALCLVMSCTACHPDSSAAAQEASADDDEPQTDGNHKHTNLLSKETSPYLLQHAHNPVHWHPWGPEAFAKAKKEGKPVFLSVGYSTCYWCHVMERESFEKEDVAQILNEHFVAIKVDREERPDVDEQFMITTQLVTGRGGWPNSVWLTPEGKPWMAGTYFPRDRFKQVLTQLAEIWKTRRDEVNRQADRLADAMRQTDAVATEGTDKPPGPELISKAIADITQKFDRKNGGFGTAPKFPPHGDLRLLIQKYRHTKDAELLTMIQATLDAMLAGGIRDHLGGGFHRYSTDDHWLLPHFEKMLYDNAQLMRAYVDGFALTGDERYREVVEEMFVWLQREMTDSEGGFYSAIDSESEQEEGRFYVWTSEDIQTPLGSEDGRLFADVYGVLPTGNFTEEATGKSPGTNILYLPERIDVVAGRKNIPPEQLKGRLTTMRDTLLTARSKRTFPHLDDKVLTSWNALMIESLAVAGREFNEPRYTTAAAKAAGFVLKSMVSDDGTLLRTFRNGQAKQPAFLDDYAFLIGALIEVHAATKQNHWLKSAQSLADDLLQRFEDKQHGAFFFTTADNSDILARSRNLLGGGNIPSGNGVAAQVLLKLDRLQPSPVYRAAAVRTLNTLSSLMWRSPGGADSLVLAVADALQDGTALTEPPQAAMPPTGSSHSGDGDIVSRFEKLPVSGELLVSNRTVRPGQQLDVTIVLTVKDGWHLYGPNPDVDFLIETKVELLKSDGVRLVKLTPPKGTDKLDRTVDRKLVLYEGELKFRIILEVAPDAVPGNTRLEFQVTSQACDDERCLPPEKHKLPLSLTIEAMPSQQ